MHLEGNITHMKENHNKDNILFYFVLFSFIVSILLGLIILITDFMKGPIPNYLKYGFKTTEVKKNVPKKNMYQKYKNIFKQPIFQM